MFDIWELYMVLQNWTDFASSLGFNHHALMTGKNIGAKNGKLKKA